MGLELVDEAIEKIRLIKDILKVAENSQQKYDDPKHKMIYFEAEDFAFLKIKSMKKFPYLVNEVN